MTADLIALVLTLSLPVRLALLDADPTGAGWFINKWGRDVFRTAGDSIENVTDAVSDGTGAWLPCNPLAIVEHAARLAGGCEISPDNLRGDWAFKLTASRGPNDVWDGPMWLTRAYARDKCPHTAAVALLREVVSG